MSCPASSQPLDEETFYLKCRAVYLSVFRSSLTNITSKQQLCRVLQLAGRNPSLKTLRQYWGPATSTLNFDDFCEILKSEKQTDENELLRIFKGMDVNGDGFISHRELEKALTTSGEKMTVEEIEAIFSIADANKDGKLDYAEFCRTLVTTAERCQSGALERLQADAKMRRQNFGSQIDRHPKGSTSSPSSPSSPSVTVATATTTALPHPPSESQRQGSDPALRKESRTPSRLSSARSRRSSLSSAAVTMSASAAKASGETLEPTALQDWQHAGVRGCFYLEEEGSISSLQYRLHLPQPSSVYLSIQPLSLGAHSDKPSPQSWMSVDTALLVTSAGQSKDECSLLCLTEARDKDRYVWRGELPAGSYFLLPFTSGCRLRRRSSKTATPTRPEPLVYRTDTGELDLTRELREALSDIFDAIDLDGNGLISLEEYNLFELRTSGEKCDEEAWAICNETFDTRRNQLTRQGFMELHLMEATEKDGDPSDLWLTLEAMGYNRALELVEACPFQIDVQCEGCPPTLQPLSLAWGPRLLSQALQRSILASGEPRALRGHDNVLVYTYRGEHRISALVANRSNQKVTVHVNNDHSKNCCSSRGMSVFAVEVPAKTKMVHQHVLPINERQEWTYCCVESTLP